MPVLKALEATCHASLPTTSLWEKEDRHVAFREHSSSRDRIDGTPPPPEGLASCYAMGLAVANRNPARSPEQGLQGEIKNSWNEHLLRFFFWGGY